MQVYAFAHIVHLFCAILFVGGVLFEALVLSVLHTKRVSQSSRKEVEQAIASRVVRVMPIAVLGVFVSGVVMVAERWYPVLIAPWSHAFAIQLAVKIILASSVLVHFVIAVYKIKSGTLTKSWSKYIHKAVLLHMLCIVLLAKTMFYVA